MALYSSSFKHIGLERYVYKNTLQMPVPFFEPHSRQSKHALSLPHQFVFFPEGNSCNDGAFKCVCMKSNTFFPYDDPSIMFHFAPSKTMYVHNSRRKRETHTQCAPGASHHFISNVSHLFLHRRMFIKKKAASPGLSISIHLFHHYNIHYSSTFSNF